MRLISPATAVYLTIVTAPETTDAILLAGPTTSGKSALALTLAERFGGTIINADSMQVYRDLRIITARPSPADEARVPHLLYGHVDAAENYSVGRWCVDAQAAIAATRSAGRLPILVGGTGLYFKTLIQGLAAVPPVPAGIRASVRDRLAADGVAPLYAELQQRDPATAARLMPGDRSRITRALEVVLATGRSLSDWHGDGMAPSIDRIARGENVPRCRACRALPPHRCALRCDARVRGARRGRRTGAAGPRRGAAGDEGARRAMADPPSRGQVTLEEAAEGGKRDTRRYTKRQATWFRNQLPDFVWAKADEALGLVAGAVGR